MPNYFLGQPEELEPIAPTDEEEQIIKITETKVDSNSGKSKIINYAISYCKLHSTQGIPIDALLSIWLIHCLRKLKAKGFCSF